MLWRLRMGGAFAWVMPMYWLTVFPQARRELRAWRRRAQLIPDPLLRGHALRKLRTEGVTAEGAAAFAILGTVRACRRVVRACVAFEVLYDYVDALGEEALPDVLGDNRRLYGALAAALAPAPQIADWYPHRDDGGYMRALVTTCHDALRQLPAHAHVAATLHRLALRAGEAQSLHHAIGLPGGAQALAAWAQTQQPADCALEWWELAAAAGSPLGAFALIAAAAHPGTDEARTRAVERAYFPWIAALSWLLESLVDRERDAASGAHSFVAHYGLPQSATRRLMTIAAHAVVDAQRLPQAARHTLLLAGMTAMYLSDAGADRDAAATIGATIGGPLRPLLWLLRLRRRLS